MMRWYVVQVYAGYEELAKTDIEKRIAQQGLQEDFGQVFIPSAKLKQFFVEDATDQQLFPGYILIEMNMKPETHRLVSISLRVLKFLGGKEPVPLSRKEIDRILSQMKGEIAVGSVEKQELFNIGSEIEIKDGPFASFVGVVDSVDMDNEKLTVMVSIFGRMTPVELGFNQVKR